MTSLNRGEWSELYGVLFLLVKPKINIVDAQLRTIEKTENLFLIKEIISNSSVHLRYKIVNETILIYMNNKEYNEMSIEQVNEARQLLINEINSVETKSGAFEITPLNSFLNNFSGGNTFKTGSKIKDDIELVVFDSRKQDVVNLTYSIKSCLGSPATILNSSKNTDFKYKIRNFKADDINIVNQINTRTKLLDRIDMIETLGGEVEFHSVVSDTFKYNLMMVDTKMPDYLGNALLYSYQRNNKNLKEIFYLTNNFEDYNMAEKKLGDLIAAISFGFFPGERWDGINTVTGGLVIVKENGDVSILDLIYYGNEVRKYLVNESKLDSSSSTRYNMLELFEEGGEVFFTLNLQIRYKK